MMDLQPMKIQDLKSCCRQFRPCNNRMRRNNIAMIEVGKNSSYEDQGEGASIATGRNKEDIVNSRSPIQRRSRGLKCHIDSRSQSIISSYYGTRDPSNHVATSQSQIFIRRGYDAISCKMFVGTLKDVVLEWFTGLHARSVKNFKDLWTCFIQRLSVNRQKKWSWPICLMLSKSIMKP